MENEARIRETYGAVEVDFALILGSGLSSIFDEVDGEAMPYSALDNFPKGGVTGHNHALKLGKFEGKSVIVFGGREHYYEHGNAAAMREPVRLAKSLGARRLILTNAAGSLREDVPPGSVMLINDYLNLAGANPLIGEPTDARFVNMVGALDETGREAFQAAAKSLNIDLPEGVYAWWSGPSFESPAEIRMLRTMGADAVGMSTVPEVILARFFGIDVSALSVLTNMGAGMSTEQLSHEHTKEMAPIGAAKLEKLLRHALQTL